MTVFITHCWKKAWHSALALPWALLLALAFGVLGSAGTVHAQERGGAIKVMEASLHTRESVVQLNAAMEIALPSVVQEALHKGIPIFFVAQARIVKPRWYWANAVVADVQRYYRLSYQPLTNRWRLSISAERLQPGGGLAFGQNFDSMDEALGVLRRIIDWRVAEAGRLAVDTAYTIEFEMKLDVSQLPRPLQIGTLGQDSWELGAHVEFQWELPEESSESSALFAPVVLADASRDVLPNMSMSGPGAEQSL